MKHFKPKHITFLFILLLSLASCNSTRTALFDQYSYEKTIELKVETIHLMNKALTPYSTHRDNIETLSLNIEKLIEYEKNKPNNEITFEMWKVLNDKEKNLLAGFLTQWQTKEMLSKPFIEESQKQIMEAFNLLIQYEIKKDRESKDNLLQIINLKT